VSLLQQGWLLKSHKAPKNGFLGIVVVEHDYPVTSTFGFTEDQYFAAIHFLLKQLGQLGVLLILLEEDELLSDPMVGLQLCGTNHDSVGVLQEVSSYCFYLFGPCGAPKQRLPVWSDLLQAQLDVSD